MGLACIPKLGYDDVQKNIFKQNAFKIRLSVGISRSKKKKTLFDSYDCRL